jgi:hypothetical protein
LFFESRSHCIIQAGLKLLAQILLLQAPKQLGL